MMKKVVVINVLLCCFSPVFAQQGKTALELITGKIGADIARQTQAAISQATRAADNAARASYLAAQQASVVSEIQYTKIINIPDQPSVKLSGKFDNSLDVLSVQLLSGSDSWNIIRPADATGKYMREVFLPQNISENEPSFYRGMSLVRFADLKNLLINGLEIRKSNYEGKIFVSRTPVTSLWYATMGNDPQFPVLIKIPSTPTLRLYAPEVYPPHTLQTAEETVFRRDVPPRLISDVWVFLAVDGKPDWYKVVLEKDELVFIPAKGEMKKLAD